MSGIWEAGARPEPEVDPWDLPESDPDVERLLASDTNAPVVEVEAPSGLGPSPISAAIAVAGREPAPAAAPPMGVGHISEFADRIMAELELRLEFGDDAVGGEALEFVEIDRELVVEAGKLIVVASREGVGKTAWALQESRTIATRLNPVTGRGGTVFYYITEMGVQETVERIVCSFAHLDSKALKRNVTQDTIDKVRKAFDLLAQSGLHIINAAGQDIDTLVKHAWWAKKHFPDLRAVFVDNLTGINPSQTRRSQGSHEYIGEIVEKLNMLAMTDIGLAVPVFLMAHLVRPDKMARHKKPTSMDLAGSDKLNRWANVIVLLHEKSEEEREAQAGTASAPPSVGGFGGGGVNVTTVGGPMAGDTFTVGGDTWSRGEIGSGDASCSHEFLVTKNRSGRKFTADLNFIGSQMRFVDPKKKTVRPYDMPEAEAPARTEFRKRMAALGDI